MVKKSTLIFMVLALAASMVAAQTLKLEPYGISPRDASKDPNDLFDRAYNGLLNVGVETQMYLKGSISSGKLTTPTWSIAKAPTGSVAAITKTVDLDSATQVAVFTPDLVGTYEVNFSDGSKSASVTINSATYVGVADGNCALCHSAKTNEWKKTGHYSLFERAMNGDPEVAGHYASYCISCHVTGYDAQAKNNGFDDRPFVFPDSLYPGQYDSLLKKFPDAMKLARIQCESCHGPASAHMGVTSDSKMVSSLSTENCAWCHDSGTHHVYPEQLDYSAHAHATSTPSGPSRAACVRCHTAAGFVDYVNGVTPPRTEYVPITCSACHDPHSDQNAHQVRTVSATLATGEAISEGGLGKLCMNCHQSRQNAATYTNAASTRFGPHYAPQADMINGKNAVTFGKNLPTSPHLKDIENSCVECHMAPGTSIDPNTIVGSHSFKVVDNNGKDNVKICEPCHGNVGESFHEKKFYVNGKADHDGDGKEEGLQEEVQGLMDKLASLLPNPDPHAEVNNTWTKTELKAAFNHRMVYYDGSLGIHNPAFTVALLKVSIQALENNAIEGEIVAIEDVPNDQGKQVTIIWDKFVDDGVAVDPVSKYIVKRLDGEVWVGVGEYTAHGADRYALVVPTLYDSTAAGLALTTFKVVAITMSGVVHESKPGQGYSVDNLVPHAPGNFMAMAAAGNVELSWEAPADPDINYYKLYRSTDPSFVPSQDNLIATTVDLKYTDKPASLGSYYYVVAAVDFSGNLGEFTNPVSAILTSVDQDGAVPLSYELYQNYPNPFNPETSIKFGLKAAGHVTLTVYNSTGQMVKKLIDQDMTAGNHSISFIADGMTSGVYIYRIMVTNSEGNQFQAVRKMILMK